MQRQLSLWPEEERLDLWESLDPETKKAVIALIARLIGKAVQTGEDDDER